MLKRIRPDQIRIGMFIHELEGPWLTHPFWRRRFVIADLETLTRLRESGLPALVIDVTKGLDVLPDLQAVLPLASVKPRPALRAVVPRPAEGRSSKAERERATRTVNRARKVMRSLFEEARLGEAIQASKVTDLVDDITESVTANPSMFLGLTRLKNKDEYTYMHSVAVCALMVSFGRRLELDDAALRTLGMGGLLHDVGKMVIPGEILNKPGKLTAEEWTLVKTHCERGYDMLKGGEGVPDVVLDICLHHHEKIDGTGYPFGLAGDQLSLPARMGAICDIYDALTSNRIYKSAWTPEEAVTQMRNWHGHLDQGLMFNFVQTIGIYPVGMLVRLRSDRLGVVLGERRKTHAGPPRVRVFHAIQDDMPLAYEDVILSNGMTGDQIVSDERPEHWNLGDWDKLRTKILAGEPLPRSMRSLLPRSDVA
jgi:putative nucleotidyltransferase with HDIG domain